MPRQARIDRPKEKCISLPQSLLAAAELQLYSQVEGRVPYGEFSRYIESLIRKDLASKGVQV